MGLHVEVCRQPSARRSAVERLVRFPLSRSPPLCFTRVIIIERLGVAPRYPTCENENTALFGTDGESGTRDLGIDTRSTLNSALRCGCGCAALHHIELVHRLREATFWDWHRAGSVVLPAPTRKTHSFFRQKHLHRVALADYFQNPLVLVIYIYVYPIACALVQVHGGSYLTYTRGPEYKGRQKTVAIALLT